MSIIVSNPALALCGTIQPQVLKRIITKNTQLDDSGFLYRFLFCMPPAKAVQWSDETVSLEAKAAFAEMIRRIFDMRLSVPDSNTPMEFSLSSGSYEVWVAFLNTNMDKTDSAGDDMIRAGLAKLPIHTARIALALHVLKCAESERDYSMWPLEVDAQTMTDAIQLIEWYEIELRKVIGMIQGHDARADVDTDCILNAIVGLEAYRGIITKKQTGARHCRHFIGYFSCQLHFPRKYQSLIN